MICGSRWRQRQRGVSRNGFYARARIGWAGEEQISPNPSLSKRGTAARWRGGFVGCLSASLKASGQIVDASSFDFAVAQAPRRRKSERTKDSTLIKRASDTSEASPHPKIPPRQTAHFAKGGRCLRHYTPSDDPAAPEDSLLLSPLLKPRADASPNETKIRRSSSARPTRANLASTSKTAPRQTAHFAKGGRRLRH
ncbi:hypothetical protein AZ78_2834 [Lysobacter capsici AZ78]|uniref:Uncharacterized protein n=1 Tax=Lysobacter capsici AZ78 TaxID=1444315 RepID=A0A125MN32_9GAMM|nr:hypothetical protein AZ78_2834 [Lysobacter capsici AZ78]